MRCDKLRQRCDEAQELSASSLLEARLKIQAFIFIFTNLVVQRKFLKIDAIPPLNPDSRKIDPF